MTATFTLTGQVFDQSNQPVVDAKFVIQSQTPVVVDGTANRIYLRPPVAITDSEGFLKLVGADDRGVPLLVGLAYTIRSVVPSWLPTSKFDGPTTAGSYDLSDLLIGDVDPGEGGSVVADPDRPGFYLGATPDTAHLGFFLPAGLTADSAHPGFYLIGA